MMNTRFVILLLAVWLTVPSGHAWAQPVDSSATENESPPPVEAEATPAGETTDSAAPEAAHVSPKVTETPQPPDIFQKVDALFKHAVDGIEMVLFYRLGKWEREFIVFKRDVTYVRPVGSFEPFRALDADAEVQLIDADRMQVLAARGEFIPGHIIAGEQQPYRLGTLDGQSVEYLVRKLPSADGTVKYGQRFRWLADRNEYQLMLAKRNMPGDKFLDQKTVDTWAEKGWLKTNDTTIAGRASYIQTEPVGGIPIVVAWLALGAVFFTVYMQGFNFWGFRHAVDIVRGKYDNPAETGEVTHFQALASALSATIGLGNIAGVTIAMTLGGPGAFFWMLLCGLFGMCTKFVECTLGQKYRLVRADGTVLGGPMRYLHAGLVELRLGALGAVLSIVFTIMCVLASFGGGNMLQANQAGSAMLQMFQQHRLEQLSELNAKITTAANADDTEELKALQTQRVELNAQLSSFEFNFKLIYGVILAALVGVVIIGGIKRIAAAASKIVPAMCLMYMGACLYIIIKYCIIDISRVVNLIGQIFTEAFTGEAMGAGIIGVLVVGVQRAAFSNEAGAGSAAIAHSAAKTEEPIREGCVALLGPFIDTIIVCSMTALVILITGAWDNNEWIVDQGLAGAALTSQAFKTEISWFPILLSLAVTLFAYSTIISWSYYGEKSWETLFGTRSTVLYKILTVICVFIGTIVNLGSVLDFSDMMILGMAFPNIAGVVLLAPLVKKDLFNYWKRYQAGEFVTYK